MTKPDDTDDERVTAARLYSMFESNPQQAGRLLTVAQAEQLEAGGHPWPVCGDRSTTRPLRPNLRKLTAAGIDGEVPRAELTISAWLQLWLDAEDFAVVSANGHYAGKSRDELRQTAEGKRAMYMAGRRQQVTEYLIPRLNEYVLIHLTAADVEALADTLSTSIGKRGKPLSRSTLKAVLGHLRRALQEALDRELIDVNPADGYARYLSAEPKSAQWWEDYHRQREAVSDASDGLDQEAAAVQPGRRFAMSSAAEAFEMDNLEVTVTGSAAQ